MGTRSPVLVAAATRGGTVLCVGGHDRPNRHADGRLVAAVDVGGGDLSRARDGPPVVAATPVATDVGAVVAAVAVVRSVPAVTGDARPGRRRGGATVHGGARRRRRAAVVVAVAVAVVGAAAASAVGGTRSYRRWCALGRSRCGAAGASVTLDRCGTELRRGGGGAVRW